MSDFDFILGMYPKKPRGGPADVRAKKKRAYRKRNKDRFISSTPEYNAWKNMKDRCLNPRNRAFHNYGGRGIAVCDTWLSSFEAFLAHVGPRPSAKHSLDRYPDNDGPYAPGNVRWATVAEQARNKRSSRLVVYAGEQMNLTDACRKAGLPEGAVHVRLNYGWTIERALSTPLDQARSRARKAS